MTKHQRHMAMVKEVHAKLHEDSAVHKVEYRIGEGYYLVIKVHPWAVKRDPLRGLDVKD